MESIFVRYRNLLVLLAVLVAQIVGLAMQVRQDNSGRNTFDPKDQSGVRLIRLWANAVVSPPEKAVHNVKEGIVGLWTNYFDLRGVKKQNEELKQTIGRLRLEQAELLEDARQGQRLQALLDFQEHYIYKTVPAQVYGSGGSIGSHVFYIDKGTDNGLKRDMAVITSGGIVGKVRDAFPHSSQVLAINDQTSGAGVILATARIRGILRGDASGQLEVVGILADERIKPGEKVFTAGGDMIFPRGLPVGEVTKIVRDPERDGFVDVLLKPAAHLNRLDEVLVIISMEPRFPAREKQDMATSEQIDGAKAAVIQSQIQAQRKAAQITAERLPTLIEPNVPPNQQPLNDSAPPVPMKQPPQPLHPDQFSPMAADSDLPAQSATPAQSVPTGQAAEVQTPAGKKSTSSDSSQSRSGKQAAPRRQP